MTADHALPLPNEWVGQKIAQNSYENDREAGRRQKS